MNERAGAASDDGAASGGPAVSPAAALLTAVLAISFAGPLVRFTDAPALAVAAWRLTLSVLFIGAVLAVRRTPRPRLSRREWGIAIAGGCFLAAHFWSWIASLDMTTISSSVVLVSSQPVFVAILSGVFLGEAASRRQWLGILVAVAGAAIIAWGDFGRGREAIIGDALALGGALFVAIYYVIGRRLRPTVDLWWYIFIIYGVAALVLMAAVVVLPGVPMTGYATQDWVVFVALAAGPMMLGHTAVNYALRYVRSYIANLVLLTEPITATIIAWLLPAIGEVPGAQVVVGGAAILLGIALTLSAPGET